MIRTKFFNDPDGGYTKFGNPKLFDRVWKKVLDFEEKTGLSLDIGLTREEYISMFNSMKFRRITPFVDYRGCVLAYVRYLIDNSVLPPEQEDILISVTADDLVIYKDGSGVQYYKDLGMLRSAIQDSVKSSGCYDETKLDLPVVILYLAWYGLSQEEIIEYPKTDVLDDGIIIHGEKLRVPQDVLEVFVRFRDAEGYYQKAKGVIFRKYVFSDYLIRSERNAQLTTELLRPILCRFNVLCDKAYSLSYKVVYDSGIFNRAYRLECEGFQLDLKNPKVASEVFGTNNKRLCLSRIKDYNFYKQLYN